MIRAYQGRCTAIVREYDGFVAKYMGDGILVYFGYPKSLERNAERAVRSGLAIVEAMALLNAELGRAKGIEIAVRIGIATGLVMVGEVVGEGLGAGAHGDRRGAERRRPAAGPGRAQRHRRRRADQRDRGRRLRLPGARRP